MRIGLFTDTYTPDVNGVVSSIVTLQKELEAQGQCAAFAGIRIKVAVWV